MAAIAGIDYTGSLTVTSLQNVININTNTGSPALDVSSYIGNLMVVTTVGNGVSGTVIVPSIKAGADTNVLNATNYVLNLPNFTNVGGVNVANIDMRSTSFGSPTPNATGVQVVNKYLYLTWLITGSATANSAIDCTIIGQKKIGS